MSKITVAAKKFGGFMKRNAFYFMIVLCIASVATVIALAVTGNFNSDGGGTINVGPDDGGDPVVKPEDPDEPDQPDQPDEPNPPAPLAFASPVNGSVTMSFSDTTVVWNDTLEQYSTHLGLDFTGSDLSVFAAERGTVSDVGLDKLNGYYVVIDHEEGYQSRYYSLDEQINVKKGDAVVKGQLLGTMSDSMQTESVSGKHLHFEMSKGDEDIDPLTVLILEEK